MTQKKSCFSYRDVLDRPLNHVVSGNCLISTITPAKCIEATYRCTTLNQNKRSSVIFTNFAVSTFEIEPARAVDTEEERLNLLSRTGNCICKVFKECTQWGLEFRPGETTWVSDYVRSTSSAHYRNLSHCSDAQCICSSPTRYTGKQALTAKPRLPFPSSFSLPQGRFVFTSPTLHVTLVPQQLWLHVCHDMTPSNGSAPPKTPVEH
jgi:hypothetical protein